MAINMYICIRLVPGPDIDPQGPGTRSPGHSKQFQDRHKIAERPTKRKGYPQTSSTYRLACPSSFGGGRPDPPRVIGARVWLLCGHNTEFGSGSGLPKRSRTIDGRPFFPSSLPTSRSRQRQHGETKATASGALYAKQCLGKGPPHRVPKERSCTIDGRPYRLAASTKPHEFMEFGDGRHHTIQICMVW